MVIALRPARASTPAGPTPGGRHRARAGLLPPLVATLGLGVVFLAELARTVATMRTRVNEDQTVLWVEARAWGRLAPRQPTFWGQAYGSSLEGIPIEVARRLGVALPTATPLVLALLTAGPWCVLAWAAWRRGRPAFAVAAFAVPLALGAFSWLFAAFYAPAAGRFLAVAAGGVALAARREQRGWLVGALAVATLGVAIDPSALLFVAPLLVLVAPRDRALAVVVAPAALWLLFVAAFTRAHPELRFWGTGAGGFAPSARRGSVAHPGRFFALFAPEAFRSWWVPAIATVVVLAVAFATRRAVPVLAAASVVVVLGVIVTSRRAPIDLRSTFFPAGRLLLALPFALWLLTLVVAETSPRERAGRPPVVASVVVVALVAAALVAAGLRTFAHDDRVQAIVERARLEDYNLVPTQYVRQDCARIDRLTGRDGLAVFYYQFWMAYACDALDGTATLAPADERRPWRVEEERRIARTRIVFWGIGRQGCAALKEYARTCTVDAPPNYPAIAVVTFPRLPVVVLFERLGLGVRPMTGLHDGVPG